MSNVKTWVDRFHLEINRAEAARGRQNEGMARVCARRAAGIVIGEYLIRHNLPDPGASAYDRLRLLAQLASVSEETRMTAGHFLTRIDVDHNLPVDADLVAEAKWLASSLLGNTQSAD